MAVVDISHCPKDRQFYRGRWACPALESVGLMIFLGSRQFYPQIIGLGLKVVFLVIFHAY